ncbi:MAG: hypothetical protein RIB98_01275 [Acidimicrobiales bacterium]
MTTQRQQVLQLYTTNSSLGSHVVAWAFHDGTDGNGPDIPDRDGSPPYVTGLDALRDGWRLLQMSQLLPPREGEQHKVSYLPFEFLLERMIDVDEVVEPNGPNTRGVH